MSGENSTVDTCCGSCGIVEIDDIKLVPCNDCDLVRYCSDDCQHNHKSEHEEECKKRAAELRDELLFKQPENSCLGDCPICMLPLSLDPMKSRMMECCSKVICGGCYYANDRRQFEQSFYCEHVKRVREEVTKYPGRHELIEIDIEDHAVGWQMEEAFGIDRMCWGKQNTARHNDLVTVEELQR